MNNEASFPLTLKDFSDHISNFESLDTQPELLKELMQQMEHLQQYVMQKDKALNKVLQDAGKKLHK